MDTIHAIGRRKAAVARVYLSKGKGNILVNGKDFKDYFPVDTMQYKLVQPFKLLDVYAKYDVNVNVNGGGTTGQAEAIRLAISRALCEVNIDNRPFLSEISCLSWIMTIVCFSFSGPRLLTTNLFL